MLVVITLLKKCMLLKYFFHGSVNSDEVLNVISNHASINRYCNTMKIV